MSQKEPKPWPDQGRRAISGTKCVQMSVRPVKVRSPNRNILRIRVVEAGGRAGDGGERAGSDRQPPPPRARTGARRPRTKWRHGPISIIRPATPMLVFGLVASRNTRPGRSSPWSRAAGPDAGGQRRGEHHDRQHRHRAGAVLVVEIPISPMSDRLMPGKATHRDDVERRDEREHAGSRHQPVGRRARGRRRDGERPDADSAGRRRARRSDEVRVARPGVGQPAPEHQQSHRPVALATRTTPRGKPGRSGGRTRARRRSPPG